MKPLLERLERSTVRSARIDPDDDLSGPDIGEAVAVVYQAVREGYQGQPGVPVDVVASRAYGYIRDMKLVTQAVDEMLECGKLNRGQDGELYVA